MRKLCLIGFLVYVVNANQNNSCYDDQSHFLGFGTSLRLDSIILISTNVSLREIYEYSSNRITKSTYKTDSIATDSLIHTLNYDIQGNIFIISNPLVDSINIFAYFNKNYRIDSTIWKNNRTDSIFEMDTYHYTDSSKVRLNFRQGKLSNIDSTVYSDSGKASFYIEVLDDMPIDTTISYCSAIRDTCFCDGIKYVNQNNQRLYSESSTGINYFYWGPSMVDNVIETRIRNRTNWNGNHYLINGRIVNKEAKSLVNNNTIIIKLNQK